MCEALLHRGYTIPSFALHIRQFAIGVWRKNLPWLSAARICLRNLPQEFALSIWHKNLPHEPAVGICNRNLSWEFAVGICSGICRKNSAQEFSVIICRGLFVFVSESFLIYVSKSCLYGSKTFLYVSKTFLFMKYSFVTVFLMLVLWKLLFKVLQSKINSSVFQTNKTNSKKILY